MSFMGRLAAIIGITTYAAAVPAAAAPQIDDPRVERLRESLGGQLSTLPVTKTRWHLSDLEAAEVAADQGDLSLAGQLMRSVRKDGRVAGVLAARTGGLVRLPKKFRGEPKIVSQLELGHESVRSVFDEMFPPTELANFLADGILLGVAVGLLEPVKGRDYPVFVRLEPENLRYRWTEGRWYYVSVVGWIPVDLQAGRWILHTPGGRIAPWQNGLWRAVGQSWIDKQHARLHKANWEAKLANPARVAVFPQGSGEAPRQSFFRQVMAWGVNTVFGITPGWDVKLLESNGRGFECFLKTIDLSDRDIVIALTGSTVLVDGGTGFANSDIHAAIRFDLIKGDAECLAYTLNTQGIPPWVVRRFGEAGLVKSALVEWDITPPEDRIREATAMTQTAAAIKAMREALDGTEEEIDVKAVLVKAAVPVKAVEVGDPAAANDNEDGSIDVDMREAA